MPNLKERFELFMSGLEGAENIDDLMTQSKLPGRKRADYLAFNRNVIIEQKSLEVDLDSKIQPLVIDFFRARGIADVDGISFASFVKLLSETSETDDLQKQLSQIIMRRVDDILAKADKQTRDTRSIFNIPRAIGIVVILNETVQLIEPDFVAVQAFHTQRRRGPAGEIRYPHNHVVLSISEAHRIASSNADQIPTETVFSDAGNERRLATLYSDILRRRWAKFNGAASVKSFERTGEITTRDPPKLFRTT